MRIVKAQITNTIIIEKSRFIATFFRINSVDEALKYIEMIKKSQWEATHNCFAYIFGEKQDTMRFSDDGEPSGTAGMPILEVLKKNNLTDTLCIVTRYFGGVKLGAGGLVRAYTRAATEALANAEFVKKISIPSYRIIIPYSAYKNVGEIIKLNGFIQDTIFNETIEIIFAIEDIRKITSSIEEVINNHLDYECLGTFITDIPA